MKESMYQDKVNTGKYMYICPGWVAGNANTKFNETPGNEKAYIDLPSWTGETDLRFTNWFAGERTYAVSSKTKYPERCVALLDFISTYEFSRIMYNGLEGTNWKMVNGKPVPNDDFLAATIDDPYKTRTGVRIYDHFMGYGNGTIDPATGVSVDLYLYSPQAVAKKLTASHRDFIAHYGQKEWIDVYTSKAKNTIAFNSLASIPSAPEALRNDINGLNNYRGMNVFKLLQAKNDAEFDKMLDELIAGMKDYHVDEIYRFFYNGLIEQKPAIDKLVNMLKK
jgi:hypothetical protein